MLRTIFIFFKSLTLILLFIGNLYAEELTIIPLKKPFLDKITERQKIEQGIIRPKSKPIQKIRVEQISSDTIIPVSKPNKKEEKIKTDIVKKITKEIEVIPGEVIKKDKSKISFLIPKSKPLVVKKSSTIKKKNLNIIIKEILI